jgi:ketosteroid isomerase-like protein
MPSNIEVVRRGYEHFAAHGDVLVEIAGPDFVWDMSHFGGWPEQQTYEGVEGTRAFLQAWSDTWDDWRLEVASMHEAGDKVVAIVHQSGRSKTTGLQVEMKFAQVWTVRDGVETRMDMYQDLSAAMRDAGIVEETPVEN